MYECRAVNKVGSDVTKATLRCGSKANLILTPQMPKVGRRDGMAELMVSTTLDSDL